MEQEASPEMKATTVFCPECGSEESGYFCRNCGALVRGEDLVLCPRCHQIVPHSAYCNQCGQGLSGIALHLRQLALAGSDFWVASPTITAPAPPAEVEPDFSAGEELPSREEGEMPDWLQEMPVEALPAEAQARLYPALQPVPPRWAQGRSLVLVSLLLALMLVGLVAIAVYVLIQAGWFF